MKGGQSECLCLLLLLLQQTSVSRPEKFQVFGSADPVVAEVGEDVVLPCYLKPNISVEDMRVEWFRVDSSDYVHLYQEREIRNENQISSYRRRTALFPEELKQGNASLRLTRVQASDEGQYKCFIKFTQLQYDDAPVEVEIRGTEPVISMEGHREWGIGLLCEAKRWDLQPELIWLDSEGHSLPAGPTETHRGSMDSLIVRKRIVIQDRHTKRVTCRVQLQQRSLEKDTEFHITAEMFPLAPWEVALAVIFSLAAFALIGSCIYYYYRTLRREQHRQEEELGQLMQRGSQNQNEHSPLMNESIIRVQQKLKNDLKKKFECIPKGLAKQGHSTLLSEVYTELYITEGGNNGLASKRQIIHETEILCNDIFKPSSGQRKTIRTVMTKGTAGIGKTVSVQKFTLDWAEGKANQDIHFIFPLSFRDLNLKKGRKFSLMQLLLRYFPELKEIEGAEHDAVKVLFIFDGLNECWLPLDFQNNEIWCDITKPTSVDVLLTNLINGNLFPSAFVWITSRPAAANQIPDKCVHRVTEIRGFNDPQKEEYFRKKISDQNMAKRIISHIKSSRSLYIMCHIPVFCWISATVLEKQVIGANTREIPKTLTEMYTHFLLILSNIKNQKDQERNGTGSQTKLDSDTEIILKVAELAFQQLEKCNLIFCKQDLKKCGIDINEAPVYSGLCTEIFKEESGLNQEKVYCFVDVSIQEYLAAFYVFHSFVNQNINVLTSDESRPQGNNMQPSDLHKSAVDQALQSKNGHLDLFLRFLLGFSLDSNQRLLQGLLTQTDSRSQSIEETVKYIKGKIRAESSAERTINLFHCLSELKDNSLVEQIQNSLRSGALSDKELEPDQCSALAFVLLMSEEVLDVFELKMYNTSAAGHQRLVPVVKNCRKAVLDSCKLTQRSWDIVVSALESVPSHLIELDLSYNNLEESRVEQLCAGLKSPNCKLQSLRLASCDLTEKSSVTAASALQSVPSNLIELDLSCNSLGDSGVERLCAGLKSPNCKLQRLRLDSCDLTEKSCDTVASALQSVPSHLIELDLSYNNLGDSGVKQLCAGLESPNCKLQSLGLSGCRVTERGCAALASALHSTPSHLTELDLSFNHLGDLGVKELSAGLDNPICKLETLLVDHGGENKNRSGPRKYACQLTLDLNTAHNYLCLSEGDRKVTRGMEEQPYSYHQERFGFWSQVLCREGLSGTRCYWEAEWSGTGLVLVAVTYKGISRKGGGTDCRFGGNINSWSLDCSGGHCAVWHNNKSAAVPAPSSCRVGVYLDWPAGTLSFYSVSSDTLTLLHRFHTTFTQPLYPGFEVWQENDSVSLCQMT
ncbi:NACHT, LRR and PYD domains-containing protein 12-like isoform X2 [Megalops cyprinoides]|uniref:NACHT, LRR and PYD domains-containing protein 12-like isoform X2 n=1 Tax=Megalops cyprinoides TaxID=118141 RepID=UPI001864D564|nr:NACHT, LRR and PYD domains-containing protein 12-like isoform X2 [Megalops cyprinoides]